MAFQCSTIFILCFHHFRSFVPQFSFVCSIIFVRLWHDFVRSFWNFVRLCDVFINVRRGFVRFAPYTFARWFHNFCSLVPIFLFCLYHGCRSFVHFFLFNCIPVYLYCLFVRSFGDASLARVRFVRFANMLINDSIYHMDEAIKYLSAIKIAQVRDWGAQRTTDGLNAGHGFDSLRMPTRSASSYHEPTTTPPTPENANTK